MHVQCTLGADKKKEERLKKKKRKERRICKAEEKLQTKYKYFSENTNQRLFSQAQKALLLFFKSVGALNPGRE